MGPDPPCQPTAWRPNRSRPTHRACSPHGHPNAQTPTHRTSYLQGAKGPGQWFTVYTNPGHAYLVIAGLRLDTSSAGAGGGKGPRWRATGRPSAGYKIRHPRGF